MYTVLADARGLKYYPPFALVFESGQLVSEHYQLIRVLLFSSILSWSRVSGDAAFYLAISVFDNL